MAMNPLGYYDQQTESGLHIAVTRLEFDAFSHALLGLGDISATPSGEHKFDALAAILDLQGFTAFCDARDPHIMVPEFIDEFLSWLFAELKNQFIKGRQSTERLRIRPPARIRSRG
jgi:hypothetical protein